MGFSSWAMKLRRVAQALPTLYALRPLELFDADYYRASNRGNAAARISPLLHFLAE